NLLLSKGDAAFAEGDMAGALKRYAEAEELRPFDRLAKIKIGQTKKHIEQLKVTAEQLFQKYIDQARLMERYRNYELAKEYYTKALEQKPEEKPKFDQQLNMLDSKIRILVEFTEKYKAGLYKEAIKDFDKVIKKDPTNSDFFLGRGKCYDKLNDTKRALNDYSKAIEFDNNNLDAIYRRAILYRKLNDPYKAIADLKVYQTIDKSNLSIYLDLSDLHVQTKNNSAAIEDLDMALKINAKAAAILFAKAQLIEKEGNLKQALTVYEEVVLADSTNNPDYYFHKGKCAYQLSLIDKAAADFATARKYGLNESYKADIASFAEEQFQVFNQAFAERKNQAALTAINNAIAINPNWAIYRFNKALVLKELNQLKESVTNFTDAVKIDELYAEAYFQRGLVLQLLQEYETSITDFKQLLTLKPDDYRGFYQMGISLFQLQQYSEVVDNILRSLILIQNGKAKIAPNIISENYNLLAKSYYNIKDFVKAREAAKNAIRNNELNAEALFYRGYANYQLNELSDAASDIKKALELQPQPFWYAILGKVYQQKEEYVYAVDAYSKALSGKPDAVLQPFFYYRGFTKSLQNNFDDAVKDYEQILQLGIDSSFENFDFELGVLYLNTSQYQQAESFLQKSLQKYPNQPLAQYKLAIVVGLQNKLDQSLELFDKSFTNKAVPYSIIKRDKQLQFIKDDKRFKALIKKWY
ncbi:MAG: tetratricopeptide repeat protein, partial [Chitinophagaceae bacterium]